jgi:hypothetical protein
MEVVLAAILGFAIGFVFACLGVLSLKIGTLRIDRSDPTEAPYMFLEISKDVGDISGRKYVLLDVKNENYISQK